MHLLGTIAMILVLSLMIAGLLKLNYKDLWVSEDDNWAFGMERYTERNRHFE